MPETRRMLFTQFIQPCSRFWCWRSALLLFMRKETEIWQEPCNISTLVFTCRWHEQHIQDAEPWAGINKKHLSLSLSFSLHFIDKGPAPMHISKRTIALSQIDRSGGGHGNTSSQSDNISIINHQILTNFYAFHWYVAAKNSSTFLLFSLSLLLCLEWVFLFFKLLTIQGLVGVKCRTWCTVKRCDSLLSKVLQSRRSLCQVATTWEIFW